MADLGRFRPGDVVGLALAVPEVPTAPPSAVISGPNLAWLEVPLCTRDGGLTFAAALLVGRDFGPGTFQVTATAELASGPVSSSDTFDVVGGGDPDGLIIAIYEHEGAFGRSVLAQTASGRLLRGADPWI